MLKIYIINVRGGIHMNPTLLVIATNNVAKIKEYRNVFDSDLNSRIVLKSLSDMGVESDPEERDNSYEDNAFIKAKAAWNLLKVSLFADDSGIEIDALGGAPGMHTKRFCAPENAVATIMEKMKDVPYAQRTAKLVCAVCCVDHLGRYWIFKEEVPGRIVSSIDERYNNPCWPYNVFTPYDFPLENQSLATIPESGISKYSHRGRAARHLALKIMDEN